MLATVRKNSGALKYVSDELKNNK